MLISLHFFLVSVKILAMEIKIVKERRKTLLLKIVSREEILVKAPIRLNDAKINDFISSKKKWFEDKIKKMESLEEFANHFSFDKYIYEFGEPIMETKELAIGFPSFSVRKKNKVIREQYFSMFSYVKDRVNEFVGKYNFKVKEVNPCVSTCKWGSFSSSKEMKINFKAIILPKDLIDYIIIHELCHSKHMNHKPQFWKEVEKYCPNYKVLRQKIKEFSFLLKTPF